MGAKIVCLCGSTKFKEEFEKITMEESLKGNVVLSVGCFDHHDEIRLSEGKKKKLGELHRKKIDMADEIVIINVKGYIGESTSNEIKYAKGLGKPIRYLVNPEWYGDGTEELGDVELNESEREELEKIFSGTFNIIKSFDKDKLISDLIKNLENTISDNNIRSINIINILLKKLTELSNDMENGTSWTYLFNTNESREISDYVNDALSRLANGCMWSK